MAMDAALLASKRAVLDKSLRTLGRTLLAYSGGVDSAFLAWAAEQHRVAAPLRDAGLTKQDIRDLSRAAGLRIWDKPASACLSSRIEYGRPVTREALSIVEQGEDALRALGFRQFRVRHHGEIVRIEIARDELPRVLDSGMAATFTATFKALGFKFVTLDLEGFRSGSLNSLLSPEQLTRKTG